MSTEELEDLPPKTLIYVPTEWDVFVWQYAGKVLDRNFYTLLYPPDQDGVINNRRPVTIDGVQLRFASLDEQSAWLQVLKSLEERKQWIYKMKLTQ